MACHSNMSICHSYPPLRQPWIHYQPASKQKCCCCPQHWSFCCRLLHLQSVITTVPSLILPKDSWIETWIQSTLISSLYFEVLLMDWRVRALSTLSQKVFSPPKLSLPKPIPEMRTLLLQLNKPSNQWEHLRHRGRTPSNICPPSTKAETLRSRTEKKMKMNLLQLLSPAEQVLVLLVSSNPLLTLYLKLLKRHNLGMSSVSTPMIPSCQISLRARAWKDKSKPLGWQRWLDIV